MSVPIKPYGILVGVDGSAASNTAVCWAAREAAMRHIPLTLVHVVKAVVPVYPEMSLSADAAASQHDEGRRVLEEAVKIAEDVAKADQRIPIKSELKFSPPVPTLIELSDRAEMVVVGCNGRGAVARVLPGSVSSGVVRGARCPVAVIRAEARSMAHHEQAPVLVGVDCSPASELAVGMAFDEASRRGVELTALLAWGDAAVYQLPWPEWKSEAERRLAEYLANWEERYPDVKVHRVVVLEHAGRALIEESESAQLVVVGSHDRGALTGMLLGSVSNAVVHAAYTPVILARPSSGHSPKHFRE